MINIFIFQTALVSPTNDEYEFILETIKERVEEGQGETIYEIGTGGKQKNWLCHEKKFQVSN